METEQEPSARNQRFLGLVAIFIFAAIILSIIIISTGFFDPKPLEHALELKTPGPISVGSKSEAIIPINAKISSENRSYRLRASRVAGEHDIAYGMLIGSPISQTGIAINPVGYVSFWQHSDDNHQATKRVDIISWRTWPHINKNSGENEIWLDVFNNKLTSIRINREKLWSGELDFQGDTIFLWVTSFGEDTIVDFQQLELYTESFS